MEAKLVRLEQGPGGILGALLLDGEAFCCTLERSGMAIPTGHFPCTRYSSPRFPDTWEVLVPGRSKILFHAGNVQTDSLGCVLLGGTWGKLRGDRAVLNSGATFSRFKEATRSAESLALTVVANIG